MKLTILGSSASYAGPGQACAGHLVESDGARILLDCGNGVLSNLGRVCDPLSLDAVFITHEHPDHFCDLYALQAALRYAPAGPCDPLPLYAPAGLLERIGAPLSEKGRAELEAAFVAQDLEENVTVMVRGTAVTPVPVDHTDSTFALVVDAPNGARLCYTSDAKPDTKTVLAATGANLLLADATLPEGYGGRAPHMTAAEAGAVARIAGVAVLVLTHLWPTNDRDAALAQATAEYNGQIHVAAELDTFEV